jgi:replicative superfamily II helicase
MVDFRKLRADKPRTIITDPIEIFRRMPKPQGINDLYTSQAEVLREWYSKWHSDKKGQRDFVIKLHTGGGKTLVGLLIAQSIMNETHGPVIYLSPTLQLVEQILDKARAYNIPAVAYQKGIPFPDVFYNGRSVLVCAYEALFNGYSRFGTRWKNKEIIQLEGIILDDAHVASSTIRDQFTLRVEKNTNLGDYQHLTSLFRSDFEEIGKLGTFDGIVSSAGL